MSACEIVLLCGFIISAFVSLILSLKLSESKGYIKCHNHMVQISDYSNEIIDLNCEINSLTKENTDLSRKLVLLTSDKLLKKDKGDNKQ